MNIYDIRILYAYNRWATNRLLETAKLVRPADFVRELGTSHGSLKKTFIHIVWAEWIWLRRWQGESPKVVFTSDQFPDVEAIGLKLLEVDHHQQVFVNALIHDHLTAIISYENLQGQRWEYSLEQMMQHVVNHSTYHRGQVVTILRQLGYTPPPTDYLIFLDEGGARD